MLLALALSVLLSGATVRGPIPVSPNSHPFASVYHAAVNVALSRAGYVEQEYFVSGYARVFQYASDGIHVIVRTPSAPYMTRILIERPAAPYRFSGNVVLELMNPSLGYDLPLMWEYAHSQFLRNGDIYIGVTVKPIAIAALKRFDPRRYAALSMANPIPPGRTCFKLSPGDSPLSEDGLAWDVVSQIGAVLKQPASPYNPLGGLRVQKLYATGYSQTASYLVTYINAIVRQGYASLPNGRPIFDGFLLASGADQARINQCAPPVPIGDPRNLISQSGVPVVRVQSQTDFGFWLGSPSSNIVLGNTLNRRTDSDVPGDQFRLYEIPGDSHVTGEQFAFAPNARDLAALGVSPPSPNDCTQQPPTDFPAAALLDAMWQNLELWVRAGVPPPHAARIATINTGTPRETVVFDQFANAAGGVRSPSLDVPIAHYATTNYGRSWLCVLEGYTVGFTPAQLSGLYATHQAYVDAVKGDLVKLVSGRWLLPADATELLFQAERAPVP